ncbi:MAG: hypothetical protein QOI12_5056 [Alphaproteobacteria bacterium]|jgi:hypothetical protein|nr:hypothetical protein [Alphaproteobacteria bacterium]
MDCSGLFRGALATRVRRSLLTLVVLIVSAASAFAETAPVKPKFGPLATSIQQSRDYFRTHDAPDYWALSPYYVPQISGSACSVATIAIMMNVMLGLPAWGPETLVSQQSLLEKVDSKQWAEKSAQDGEGLTFEEFKTYVALSLEAYGLKADLETFKPADGGEATLARLRALLVENEGSDDDIVLLYFNQGAVTGDWDGPHISPLGAYDIDRRRVLIMDVDRQFYIPYWTDDETLLDAMLRPAPAEQGVLAGETGGLIRVTAHRGTAHEVVRGSEPERRSRARQ